MVGELLLDTHVALWALTDDPRLTPSARALLLDPENELFFSAASIWEIAIKRALTRGSPSDMPISGHEAIVFFREAGYQHVPVMPHHAAAVGDLPHLCRDPFDRILIAQATVEPMRFITHDQHLAAYGTQVELI